MIQLNKSESLPKFDGIAFQFKEDNEFVEIEEDEKISAHINIDRTTTSYTNNKGDASFNQNTIISTNIDKTKGKNIDDLFDLLDNTPTVSVSDTSNNIDIKSHMIMGSHNDNKVNGLNFNKPVFNEFQNHINGDLFNTFDFTANDTQKQDDEFIEIEENDTVLNIVNQDPVINENIQPILNKHKDLEAVNKDVKSEINFQELLFNDPIIKGPIIQEDPIKITTKSLPVAEKFQSKVSLDDLLFGIDIGTTQETKPTDMKQESNLLETTHEYKVDPELNQEKTETHRSLDDLEFCEVEESENMPTQPPEVIETPTTYVREEIDYLKCK
jgi:hypothetical protein